MSAFLLQAADILKTANYFVVGKTSTKREPHIFRYYNGACVGAMPNSLNGWPSPNKRFYACIVALCKFRYFRNRRKAVRWALRYTDDLRQL